MFTKSMNPTRSVIDGRDSWVFPNGKVLPVVAGGDGPVTEAKTLLDLQRDQRNTIDDGIVVRATEAIELAAKEGRALTADESELVARAADAAKSIDDTIANTVTLLRGNEAVTYTPQPAKRGVGGAVIRSEPHTYMKNGGQHSHIRDHALVAFNLNGAGQARERLERHAREVAVEMRAGSTGDTAGGTFVPPLWLLEEYAGVARAGRPAADLARQMTLPSGTDAISVPTITTGNVTAVQATENTAATTRDMVTSSTTADVTTIAGTYDFSLQLLEQSALAAGWDQLVYGDLLDDYNRALDSQVLSGTGANNQENGIYTVAATTVYASSTASTTAQNQILAGVADAISRVATTRFRTPEVLIMHPRRWFWLVSRLDTSGRPVIAPDPIAANAMLAAMGVTNYQGAVGMMLGLPVVIDSNVSTSAGTSEDNIAVWKASDAFLMEGTPRFEVFRSVLGATTDTLTARARLYNYAAFNTRYTTGVAIVGGTALSSPTF